MKRKNYYLHKDNKTGEILYLEYDKVNGYPITPKTKIEDAINVSKIIFINPSLSEKVIRRKIDIKLRNFLRILEKIEDDPTGGDEGAIHATLMEAEKLKVNILTKYVKYLGNTYGSFSLKKIQIIINQLRIKLYNSVNRKKMYHDLNLEKVYQNQNDLYYLDEEEIETKKGRGR